MPEPDASPLARKLGLFDGVMIVMGGVIGSGIFINPYVVARRVHTDAQILGAWLLGGLIALAGGFIYAELAARRPLLQGQYAYLRDAYHPSVAFLYGWGLLLVTQTGGMAAVAVTFARYFLKLTGLNWADGAVAAGTLAVLTLVNCIGDRAGSNVQSVLMVLKGAAIAGLVVCGLYFPPIAHTASTTAVDTSFNLGNFGAAMTPVIFAATADGRRRASWLVRCAIRSGISPVRWCSASSASSFSTRASTSSICERSVRKDWPRPLLLPRRSCRSGSAITELR